MILMLVGAVGVTPVWAGDGTGGVQCSNPSQPGCDVNVGTGGNEVSNTSGSGSGGGDGKCRDPHGIEIPCERDGGWAGSDGCYYQPVDLSADTIAALGGQPAGEGGWYQRSCYNDADGQTQGIGGPVWIAGLPPVMSPAVLARQARSRLDLPDVVVKLNPPGAQLANLPVWLTLETSSWTPKSATASVPGVSVTATARPVKATWSMGDGGSVTCSSPGTAWTPATDPKAASPDCGYVYRHSSAQATSGKLTINVMVTWEVTWAGAGRSGTVPGLTTTGALAVQVQESQAVVTN